MRIQNVQSLTYKHEGSQPQGVSVNSIPTQAKSTQPQTHCSEEDLLNQPLTGLHLYL